MIPQTLFNIRVLQIPIHNSTPAKTAIIPSITNLGSYKTGVIKDAVPITNRILKILLPTIFPIAISALPFLAAATDVTSSGSDVPQCNDCQADKSLTNT